MAYYVSLHVWQSVKISLSAKLLSAHILKSQVLPQIEVAFYMSEKETNYVIVNFTTRCGHRNVIIMV